MKSIRFERLPDGTELTWNTDSHRHEIPFRTAESRGHEKLVRVIAKDDLPFGGTWTFLLADAPGGGTQLTLTEDGVIRPPIFRAMARWFFGLDTTQKDYLAHLEKHLASPKPSVVGLADAIRAPARRSRVRQTIAGSRSPDLTLSAPAATVSPRP